MIGSGSRKAGFKIMVYVLLFTTTLTCSFNVSGWAMLAPADVAAQTVLPGFGREADMKTVQTALESKIVQQRLHSLKLTDQEISSRLSKLSDNQVHQLAKNINKLSPGGDSVGGVLVLVLVVLLIVWLIERV